jgi:site-specific DNA-methyltransferase (adenine-specific)
MPTDISEVHFSNNKIFEMEQHKVILGDAVQILDEYVEDGTVDLIFADPPYNIGKIFGSKKDQWNSDEEYLSWCYRWIDICVRKLKQSGSMYLMAATQNMPYIDIFLSKKMRLFIII